MSFVVDASMVLAWHFEDEATPGTEAVLERSDHEQMVVPRHWFAEVANGMLVGERRGRAVASQSANTARRLLNREIEIDELGETDALFRIMPLARAHGLTVYDGYYLELAERRGLALATLDRQLARAARSVGIEIIGQDQ